jgi:hypothetical protein
MNNKFLVCIDLDNTLIQSTYNTITDLCRIINTAFEHSPSYDWMLITERPVYHYPFIKIFLYLNSLSPKKILIKYKLSRSRSETNEASIKFDLLYKYLNSDEYFHIYYIDDNIRVLSKMFNNPKLTLCNIKSFTHLKNGVLWTKKAFPTE